MAPRDLTLVLIRHGQTPSNILGALDTGVPGPPLTELGGVQAVTLAEQFALGPTSVVYASTMQRAQQTAAPLAARAGAVVQVRDGLQEISAGHLEMRSDEAAIAEYHAFLEACAGGREGALRDGETTREVLDRYDAALAGMCAEVERAGGDRVVAVSHGAVIRAWTGRRATNLDAAYVLANPLRNTGTVVLTGHPARGWAVSSWDESVLDQTPVPTGPLGPGGEPDPPPTPGQ